MALTGGFAGASKTALLAMQIWRDDVDAEGGLLGRAVKLIFYDDQTDNELLEYEGAPAV